MNSKYNLNESAGGESFGFTLDDHEYKMVYPSSKDIMDAMDRASESERWEDDLRELINQQNQAELSDRAGFDGRINELREKIESNRSEFLDWTIQYISPVSDSAPDFKTLLLSKNVKFLMAFVKMIKSELNDG